MENKYFKNGELLDEEIANALENATALYKDGSILEARDILTEIIDAIYEFDGLA